MVMFGFVDASPDANWRGKSYQELTARFGFRIWMKKDCLLIFFAIIVLGWF